MSSTFDNRPVFYEELNRLHVYSIFAKVKDAELSLLLGGLTIECDITTLDKVGDFSLSEEKIHVFTGCEGKYQKSHQKSTNNGYQRKSYLGNYS